MSQRGDTLQEPIFPRSLDPCLSSSQGSGTFLSAGAPSTVPAELGQVPGQLSLPDKLEAGLPVSQLVDCGWIKFRARAGILSEVALSTLVALAYHLLGQQIFTTLTACPPPHVDTRHVASESV